MKDNLQKLNHIWSTGWNLQSVVHVLPEVWQPWIEISWGPIGDHNKIAFTKITFSVGLKSHESQRNTQYDTCQCSLYFCFSRHTSWTPQKEGRYKFHRDLPKTSANWLSNSYEKNKVPCKKHSLYVTIRHPLVLCENNSLNSMNFKPRLESCMLNRLVTRHIVKKTPF